MSTEACQPYRELFSDLLEGELDSTDVIRAEGHLTECSSCRAELAVLRGIVTNLQEIDEEEVPAAFASQVMARVMSEPFWLVAWRMLSAPFAYTPVRLLAPTFGVVLLLFMIRPYLPVEIRIENGPAPHAGEVAFARPIWWGGTVYVNEQAHSPADSGRVTLRPGDSLRTTDNVQLCLALPEAAVEVRTRSSLIVKTDGLYLAGGKAQIRIDDSKVASGGFKVTTPNATIVHLGTVFDVAFVRQTSRIDVLQGRVRVTSSNGASLDAAAGQYATVEPDGIVQAGQTAQAVISTRTPRNQPEDVREINPRCTGGAAPR